MSSWPRSLVARSVGAGDVSLRRAATRGLDSSEVTRALHAAIEAGIDLVDVTPEPDTERLAGEAIRSLRVRDRVLLATRVAALAQMPSGAPTRDALVERLPPRYVQDSIEATLRATRLEVLPLVQLSLTAAWRSSSAWPELTGTCERLVREGKVLAWGGFIDHVVVPDRTESDEQRDERLDYERRISRGGPAPVSDLTADLLEESWLAALNVPFNLCERAADALLAPAREKKIAILARRPLAGGALTGELGPGVRLRPNDERRSIDDATLERIAVGAAKLSAFTKREPPAARSCDAAKAQLERNVRPEHVEVTNLGELALRFVVDRGAIALPRLHRHGYVIEALAAMLAPPLASTAAIEALEL